MELVYLWVEEYKNIKKQGFNFSPRFTCKYDEEKKELTVDKKECVDIFPPNINVTAIVGENGSGKSSILEIIKALLKYEYKAFMVWKSNETFYHFSTMEEAKLIGTKQEKSSINYFTHSSDTFNTLLWMNQKNKLYDCSNDMKFMSVEMQNPNNLRLTHLSLNFPVYYAHCQNSVLYYFLKCKKENKIFNPVHYRLIPNGKYFERKLSAILGHWTSDDNKLLENIREEMRAYAYKITNNPQNLKIMNRLYIFLEKLKRNSDKDAEKLFPYIRSNKIPTVEEMNELLRETYDDDFSFELVDKLDIENYILLSKDKKFLSDIYENKLSKNIFVDVYHMILFDEMERIYDDLSSGEKDSILLISLLFNYFAKSEKQNCILLLDEIEAFYHPNWSKNFFNVLFEEIKEREVHLVLTSHSPFILSDLPKENVIFLKKDENGNCKNVTSETNIETFGANIHTLLSHGFFMEDGLMGEFAKSKINEVIDYLNGKNSPIKDDDEAQRYIHIIGEPILKRQLQKMLDSKRPSEVEKIKQQIAELQQKLDEHQHAQN